MGNIFNWFNLARKGTDNFFELCLFRLGFKKDISLKTKSLGIFKIKDIKNKIWVISTILNLQEEDLRNPYDEITKNNFKEFINLLSTDEEIINFNGIKFLNNPEVGILIEQLFDEGNSPFSNNLENNIIIDIGANIGDTTLMFAKEGAEVYAFEPVPPTYDIALKNIDLNPDLKNKVHIFNKAVSGKKGKINIHYLGENESGGSSSYSKKGKVYEVETITMENIVNNYLKDTDGKDLLLQMDCEGAEYDIVLNSDLSMFKELIIEHHQFITGIDYHVLCDNLINQGFIIDKIFPAPIVGGGELAIDEIGIIRALKKTI